MSRFYYQLLLFPKPQLLWHLQISLQLVADLLTLMAWRLVWIWLCQRSHDTGRHKQLCRDACSLFRVLTSLSPKGLGNPEWTQTAVSWNNHHYCACFIFVTESVSRASGRCSAEHQAIVGQKRLLRVRSRSPHACRLDKIVYHLRDATRIQQLFLRGNCIF